MTVNVVRGDQKELGKINKDFGQSYRFPVSKVQIKEPFKVKVESEVDDINVSYTVNGPKRMFKFKGIRQVQDLSSSPGKRQTTFDFGILTPSLFSSLYKATFVRKDRATGDMVFDMSYQTAGDTSHSRIWLDTAHKVITKREWYNQEGRQLATFIYSEPKQVGGVWINTKVTVKNVEDKVAGVTTLVGIKVNQGLSDSTFELR